MELKRLVFAIGTVVFSFSGYPQHVNNNSKSGSPAQLAAGCSPPSATTELAINNARALISSSADLFFDGIKGTYEIPKGSGKHSLFNGQIWFGGTDASGQVKVAAQRYRQNGVDFFNGPLSTLTAEIDMATCNAFDGHYKVSRNEVEKFVKWFAAGEFDRKYGKSTQKENFPDYLIPNSILNWPAHGRREAPFYEDFYLAPFVDYDGDGVYNPSKGDYPAFEIDNYDLCNNNESRLNGDEVIWWIFNDKGNTHTETGGLPIGLEVRAQAFAFGTSDEVNDMTFYSYEFINRSSSTLFNTHVGYYSVGALGYDNDDRIGCDVQRGLGYYYNGDDFDEDYQGTTLSIKGYGDNPPAIGIDFLQGPFQDEDGVDNCMCSNYADAKAYKGVVYPGLGNGYGDGIIDNERMGMRFFRLSAPNSTNYSEPATSGEYYYYLKGLLRDGERIRYGNFNPTTTVYADFMFPGDTDPLGWGTDGVPQPSWTEESSQMTPFSRKIFQSTGPFTLKPGEKNEVTLGVIWAKATEGGAKASVEKLKIADDKAQLLFDKCFNLLSGPDAPEMTIRELDKELLIYLTNPSFSNNYKESYSEVSPFIIPPDSLTEEEKLAYSSYKFQGYMVYQVKDANVTINDLNNPELARLTAQCDLNDDVSKIVNYTYDADLKSLVPSLEVNGENKGIAHSFKITEDLFAQSNKTLINHKKYYFIAIAYAHNNYKTFDPLLYWTLDGQKTPFLRSNVSANGPIEVKVGIPHITAVENGGTILNAEFGEIIQITRLEGAGNGGREVDISKQSELAVADNDSENELTLTYQKGFAPVQVRIIDPLNVKGGNYRLAFKDTIDGTLNEGFWMLTSDNSSDTIYSDFDISITSEQLIPEIGISISVSSAKNPGYKDATGLGYIHSSLTFEDEQRKWLTGVPDFDGEVPQNWIRCGILYDENNPYNDKYYEVAGDQDFLDPNGDFERILDGTWAPCRFGALENDGPLPEDLNEKLLYIPISEDNSLHYLSDVNVVFTANKDLWTRCPVIEMQALTDLAINGGKKNYMRKAPSVNKDGVAAAPDSGPSNDINAPNFVADSGMGWFPGYAIDINTGERLNMAFGEDSWLLKDNGADMIWNPTSTLFEGAYNHPRFGGKHYIFVFRNNIVEEEAYATSGLKIFDNPANRMPAYDYGRYMHSQLSQSAFENFRNVWRSCMYIGLPLLESNKNLLETDCTVKIRVTKQFERAKAGKLLSPSDKLEIGARYLVVAGPIYHDGIVYKRNDVFTAVLDNFGTNSEDNSNNIVKVENDGLPLFTFNLDEFVPIKGEASVAQEALQMINVVPNPYYAYSAGYEANESERKVKITNLPDECTIKIYTVNGELIKQINHIDAATTNEEWNLDNSSNKMIASGIYVIHVNAPGIGERILKAMIVMRSTQAE